LVVHALWWAFWSVVWWASSPRTALLSAQQRDRVLADRAAKVLRFHLKRAGTIRRCDPYEKVIDVDHLAMANLGIERTRKVLQKHSLPAHLLNALLRQFDPAVKAQAAAQPEYRTEPATPRDAGSSGTP